MGAGRLRTRREPAGRVVLGGEDPDGQRWGELAVELLDAARHAFLGSSPVQELERRPDDVGAPTEPEDVGVRTELGGEVVPDARLPHLGGAGGHSHTYKICYNMS